MNYPHHYQITKEKCVILIDDKEYDVSAWRKYHPGGAEILDLYHLRDATEAFYAFHSKEAINLLTRTPKNQTDLKPVKNDTVLVQEFRELRKKLENEGYFKRNWIVEIAYMSAVFAMVILAFYYQTSQPYLAAFFLGFSQCQTGWLGHDYAHGRGKACEHLRKYFAQVGLGFSVNWWSHKHNFHHSFPNRLEIDGDIHNEPILHLFFPDKEKECWNRKYQHLYYLPVYSLLHFSWKWSSIKFAVGSLNKEEIILIIIHWIWYLYLPLKVMILGTLISGFLTAIVVTSNHQVEELIQTDAPYCYVKDNIMATRGIHTPDPITSYWFGGMQYQLEHHLFPTMPRYYYPIVRPILKQFAEKNKLQYKIAGVAEIIYLNFQQMKKFAGKEKTA